jgi:hypothetical protein
MVAGDIGSTLDVPTTNLSFHLEALTQDTARLKRELDRVGTLLPCLSS